MTQPRGRQRSGLPASQRHRMPPTPLPPAPEPVPVPDDDPPTTDVEPPAAEVEHPRCWRCGWLLMLDLAGDLWCPHWPCEQYRQVVGTLVADRAANDRLREAIDQANGEQHRDQPRTEPPSN